MNVVVEDIQLGISMLMFCSLRNNAVRINAKVANIKESRWHANDRTIIKDQTFRVENCLVIVTRHIATKNTRKMIEIFTVGFISHNCEY
ncbi:hypothetical protein ALC57_03719 [Trachymyrmex cornetzi]|uniref:Uncharacterized protein n=1 Tax=Trachymyrmex cornetzi TaxID=471704 RepID=A0A151JM94_9HYME|nr:hypothetical protein ALC57_03719 [Trachymyrmex cornetzi]